VIQHKNVVSIEIVYLFAIIFVKIASNTNKFKCVFEFKKSSLNIR